MRTNKDNINGLELKLKLLKTLTLSCNPDIKLIERVKYRLILDINDFLEKEYNK